MSFGRKHLSDIYDYAKTKEGQHMLNIIKVLNVLSCAGPLWFLQNHKLVLPKLEYVAPIWLRFRLLVQRYMYVFQHASAQLLVNSFNGPSRMFFPFFYVKNLTVFYLNYDLFYFFKD